MLSRGNFAYPPFFVPPWEAKGSSSESNPSSSSSSAAGTGGETGGSTSTAGVSTTGTLNGECRTGDDNLTDQQREEMMRRYHALHMMQSVVNSNNVSSVEGGGESDKKPAKRKRAKFIRKVVCQVCGDVANDHIHYGAIACYSCRAFFRRGVNSNAPYYCSQDKKCVITKHTRKHCQYCRFQKCLSVGMKSSWVMTEEDKIEKRERALLKKLKLQTQQQQKAAMRAAAQRGITIGGRHSGANSAIPPVGAPPTTPVHPSQHNPPPHPPPPPSSPSASHHQQHPILMVAAAAHHQQQQQHHGARLPSPMNHHHPNNLVIGRRPPPPSVTPMSPPPPPPPPSLLDNHSSPPSPKHISHHHHYVTHQSTHHQHIIHQERLEQHPPPPPPPPPHHHHQKLHLSSPPLQQRAESPLKTVKTEYIERPTTPITTGSGSYLQGGYISPLMSPTSPPRMDFSPSASPASSICSELMTLPFSSEENQLVQNVMMTEQEATKMIPLNPEAMMTMIKCARSGSAVPYNICLEGYTTCMKRIIRFASQLDFFQDMPPEDQRSLLLANTDMIVNIRSARMLRPGINLQKQMCQASGKDEDSLIQQTTIENKTTPPSSPTSESSSPPRNSSPISGNQRLEYVQIFQTPWACSYEHEQKFHELMRRLFDLEMDETTTVLMSMMALFSVSHAGLPNATRAMNNQEFFAQMLYRYLISKIGRVNAVKLLPKYIFLLAQLEEMAQIMVTKRLTF